MSDLAFKHWCACYLCLMNHGFGLRWRGRHLAPFRQSKSFPIIGVGLEHVLFNVYEKKVPHYGGVTVSPLLRPVLNNVSVVGLCNASFHRISQFLTIVVIRNTEFGLFYPYSIPLTAPNSNFLEFGQMSVLRTQGLSQSKFNSVFTDSCQEHRR